MSDVPQHKHTNRLANESSPYLLQHAHNPVDWFAWGPEAFEKARREDKPIFLSVGYSTCYWCHVMERQCFENEAIAAEMNRLMVNIKVDREERPDVDQLYMTAVQVQTRQGGWPMSVFLLPDLRYFYGGTYFPPTDAYGRPGFVSLIRAIADAYHNRKQDVADTAERFLEILQQSAEPPGPSRPMTIDQRFVATLIERSASDYDARYGGFGGAPKFPRETLLELLLTALRDDGNQPNRKSQIANRKSVLLTLSAMADGGIHDHLGGGFHRYSTDAQWLVPHFEIMLYDNAMLGWCYAEAFVQTEQQRFEEVARGIFDFVLREMTSPDGAFYTAFDAEVDAREGQSYLWTAQEIELILGAEDAKLFNRVYGVDAGPNFADPHHGSGTPDSNILFLPHPLEQVAAELNPDKDADRQRVQREVEKSVASELRDHYGAQDLGEFAVDVNRSTGNITATRNGRPIPQSIVERIGAEAVKQAMIYTAAYSARAVHDLDARLAPMRQKLYEVRLKRQQPLLDTKIITAWNALMIRALAHGAKVLDEPRYLQAATRAADFLLQKHRKTNGGLYRTSRDGQPKYDGFLDDYAFLAQACLALETATGDNVWRSRADDLANVMLQKFGDAAGGGFYFTEAGAADMVVRQKTATDSPLPSGSAVAAMVLTELGLSEPARRTVSLYAGQMEQFGEGMSSMVLAAMQYVQKFGPIDVQPREQESERPLSPEQIAAGVVEIEAEWRTPEELRLTLQIAEGFHINANSPGEAEIQLVPTMVRLAKGGDDVAIDYPLGEHRTFVFATSPMRVYDGKAEIIVRFAKRPALPLMLNVTYHACTEDACLTPVTKQVTISAGGEIESPA